ncbi:hypothetical protein, conserved [Eimeria necatrix]|uniref:Uncharacterized protein n=1 Tax=Eimeria necatrix TaxID=51315 RepID=U6MMR9_9EIME|nr:hypothetical protein, conserved [Eimeria necatrix]CDJ65316.1 hypothetical protein, conserved [Eimeria necatrix]
MPGTCRSNHGLDSGVHPVFPVPSSMLGSADGCPTGAPYTHCSYCTQIHKDPHVQNLYPLRPDQHLQPHQLAAVNTSNGVGLGQPAGKPSEIFISAQDQEKQ